jgi:membrane-associated phospholipid phosphatase
MLAGVLGALAARYPTFPLDREVTGWVYDLGGWYEPLATLTNHYDIALAVLAGVGGCVVLLARREFDSALLFPAAAGVRQLLSIAKAAVERPRPADFEFRAEFSASSFPSGHVMTAVAVFGLWLALAPVLVPGRLVLPVRVLAVMVVCLHALGRMWAGVHWFSDTYGAVVWMSAGVCALMAVRAMRAKTKRAPSSS